jgi:hypothetical protein
MQYTVSRAAEDAAKDVEWPGPDLRRWRQTTLSTRRATATVAGASSAPSPPRAASPSLCEDAEPVAQPLSPSLRGPAQKHPHKSIESIESIANELPAVAPGQMRITNLVRVSTR